MDNEQLNDAVFEILEEDKSADISNKTTVNAYKYVSIKKSYYTEFGESKCMI